jgi:hypothetical protein
MRSLQPTGGLTMGKVGAAAAVPDAPRMPRRSDGLIYSAAGCPAQRLAAPRFPCANFVLKDFSGSLMRSTPAGMSTAWKHIGKSAAGTAIQMICEI